MTDKYLNENSSGNHVALISINIFSWNNISTQKSFLCFQIMPLFLNGYHGNNKNITVIFQTCQTIHP